MTDSTGTPPPFPGFPGFPGFPSSGMFEPMWDLMRLTPFGQAFPGAQAGGAGLSPSLSMMSDLMAPLTNVEELDKRITDMRAVEQWLKLNLSMLQSAIQALEVQRATLATLRAFGAFAQAPLGASAGSTASESPASAFAKTASGSTQDAGGGRKTDEPETAAPGVPPFDASAWWNLLQAQFNQLAQFAMAQPGATAPEAGESDENHGAASPAASSGTQRPAAKRSGATRTAGGARGPAARTTKKPSSAG